MSASTAEWLRYEGSDDRKCGVDRNGRPRSYYGSRAHCDRNDVTDFGREDSKVWIIGLDNRDALDKLIREHAIEAIVYCAAISGPMMARTIR
ncbi:nucleoside-diphosphate-sugar epimerase [Phyllobacterium trifolii]|uniref:Nucleoside-diphosphate-sugar epimerase n=1 Tax=Phyllobacterium trifolii TaxID=300193 RepID=A0A839UH07_9HYPH|nr:hypothetical protein [Phyllobacterium trifolii]MBB3148140.1 nucleoside-diphosphate-sugar epimerase [Phyllobacterium trifolii]